MLARVGIKDYITVALPTALQGQTRAGRGYWRWQTASSRVRNLCVGAVAWVGFLQQESNLLSFGHISKLEFLSNRKVPLVRIKILCRKTESKGHSNKGTT